MDGQFCDNFIMTEDGENFEMTQTSKGDPGEGVPTGGTAGQVLKKASGDDYDTEWADLDAGDVGFDSTETYQSGTVGAELSDLSRQLNDLTDVVSTTQIINTASGAIASFDDGADDLPIKKLVAQIEPVQDLHGYSNPWPAGGGKNKASPMEQGTVQESKSEGNTYSELQSQSTTRIRSIDLIPIGDNGKAVVSFNSSVYKVAIAGFDSDGLYLGRASCFRSFQSTSPQTVNWTNARYIVVILAKQDGSDVTDADRITAQLQVEVDTTTATSYEPYENLCPISGWTGAEVTRTGKNLLKWTRETTSYTDHGITFTRNADWSVTVSGTATANADWTIRTNTATPLLVGDYILSGGLSSNLFIRYNVDGVLRTAGASESRFTVTENTTYGNLYLRVVSGTTVNGETFYPMIRRASDTDATYEPYTGDQLSVTFPSSAGTVYGGTLTLNPDRTGTLVVDRAVVAYDGSESGWSSISSGGYQFYRKKPSDALETNTTGNGFASSHFSDIRGTGNNGNWGALIVGGEYFKFLNANNEFETLNDFKSWLAQQANDGTPVQILYPLKEQQVYALTASEISAILTTLYGTNNVWADTGDVEVTYPADTRLFIEKLTQPTEDDMTADHAISAGTFFQLGNTLYLATAAIAAGATITPGTNATKLSLADALNTLNS